MYKDKTILGLIPARGGSKGLPGKNIRLLLGKPLVVWTIDQALASNYIDRVIVSTENRDIAEIAEGYGAEVPFLRPFELAADNSRMIDAVMHAIEHLEKDGCYYDSVMLLQPTSPLRTTFDIDNAIELLCKKNTRAVVSLCEVEHHPYWSNSLPLDGCMKNFLTPEASKNRQELPVFYRLNGSIYLAYTDYLKLCRDFIGKDTFAYIMPRERSVDIDTELDFNFAEFLMQHIGIR